MQNLELIKLKKIIDDEEKTIDETFLEYFKIFEKVVLPLVKQLDPIFNKKQFEKIKKVKNSDMFKLTIFTMLYDHAGSYFRKLPEYMESFKNYEQKIDEWDEETLKKAEKIILSYKDAEEGKKELFKALGFKDEEYFFDSEIAIYNSVAAIIVFKNQYEAFSLENARSMIESPIPNGTNSPLKPVFIDPMIKLPEINIDPQTEARILLAKQTSQFDKKRPNAFVSQRKKIEGSIPTRQLNKIINAAIRNCNKEIFDILELDKYACAQIEFLKYTYEEKRQKNKEMNEDGSILEIDRIDYSFWNKSPHRIKYYLTEIITKNLYKNYTSLQTTYDKYQKRQNNPLWTIFEKNKVSYEKTDPEIIELLSKIELEIIKRDLDFLKTLGFDFSESINIIITYNSYITDDVITLIKELINKQIISQYDIKNNLNTIFTCQELIIKNYKLIKEKMNIRINTINLDLLLTDNKLFTEKISLLNDYTISANNFSYLIHHIDKLYIFDLVIENEIPEECFIEIAESNNPILTIKKILLCIEAEEPYLTSKGNLYKSVYVPESFICPDMDVDKFLLDYYYNYSNLNLVPATTVKELDIVKHFDNEYLIDDNIYYIGGMNFSRPKFLRNLQKIITNINDFNIDQKTLLIYALTANSIIPKNIISKLQTEDILSLKK